MTDKHELMVVFGAYPEPSTWKFPPDIYKCLDRAVELFNDGAAPLIAAGGDHGIAFDTLGIVQPFRECDKTAEYLIENGVPDDKILREGKSRDTVSNIYYLKKEILIPNDFKDILFIVGDFRIPRLKFLCERILGPGYKVSFEAMKANQGNIYNEPHTQLIQSLFLEPMKSGDHAWLDGKFYGSWMYQYWREHDLETHPDKDTFSKN